VTVALSSKRKERIPIGGESRGTGGRKRESQGGNIRCLLASLGEGSLSQEGKRRQHTQNKEGGFLQLSPQEGGERRWRCKDQGAPEEGMYHHTKAFFSGGKGGLSSPPHETKKGGFFKGKGRRRGHLLFDAGGRERDLNNNTYYDEKKKRRGGKFKRIPSSTSSKGEGELKPRSGGVFRVRGLSGTKLHYGGRGRVKERPFPSPKRGRQHRGRKRALNFFLWGGASSELLQEIPAQGELLTVLPLERKTFSFGPRRKGHLCNSSLERRDSSEEEER